MLSRLQRSLLLALVFLAASILAPHASSKTSFIPHISQGGGWSTAFHIFNLCSTTSSYTVNFYDSSGDTLYLSADGKEWRGFGDAELPALEMQSGYFGNVGEKRSGYAIVENDDGCVAIEVFHVQHSPDNTTWYVITQAQPLSGAKSGVIVPFLNFEGCDSQIVIASDAPGAATMEAFNTAGERLGDLKYIGNLFHLHDNFMMSERFPEARGEFGTVRINGNVSAVGFSICDGNLQFSRLARPMPGSQIGNPEPPTPTPPQPMPTLSERQRLEQIAGTWDVRAVGARYGELFSLDRFLSGPDGTLAITGTALSRAEVLALWQEERQSYAMLIEYAAYNHFFRFTLTGPDSIAGCMYPRVPPGATSLPPCVQMTGTRTNRITPRSGSSAPGIGSRSLKELQRLKR